MRIVRFLHTADWHLGRRLHGHDLATAQQAALDAIVDLAIERSVDLVVIAGDVFDRAFPAVDDIHRLADTLTRLHDAGVAIVCTAGNHDEGARLAANADLLVDAVTVVGEIATAGTATVFADADGPVAFYPLPYLDPDAARRDLAATDGPLLDRSHEAVLTEAMGRVRTDLAERRRLDHRTRAVVVAHAFVVTGEGTAEAQSDSERDIAVGGVASVPTAVFAGVDYVALGHLHRPRTVHLRGPQDPPDRPTIRYSGSLLRYSISEAEHVKSVTIVDLAADGTVALDVVPVPQPARMARLRGDLATVLSDAYAEHHDDFVEITLTDTHLPDAYLAQLHTRFPRLLRTTRERTPTGGPVDPSTDSASGPTGPAAATDAVTPMDRIRDFYTATRGEPLPAPMAAILADALERAHAQA